jgi:hypothetical protein
VKEKFVPNLPAENIVIDNATYHDVKVTKIPASSFTKKEMQQWLQKQNMPFADDMLKPTLHRLSKQYRPHKVQCSVDKLVESHGHPALRLPHYHPDLNPTDNIWAKVKGHSASRNVTYTEEGVNRLRE